MLNAQQKAMIPAILAVFMAFYSLQQSWWWGAAAFVLLAVLAALRATPGISAHLGTRWQPWR